MQMLSWQASLRPNFVNHNQNTYGCCTYIRVQQIKQLNVIYANIELQKQKMYEPIVSLKNVSFLKNVKSYQLKSLFDSNNNK